MEQNVSTNKMVKDPVCGKDVVAGQARGWDYLHETIVYHFCGPDCRSRFQRDAKGVLASGPGSSRPSSTPAPEGTQKAAWLNFRGLLKRWKK